MSNLGWVMTEVKTLQSAAVATGNGTALDVKGFSAVCCQILGITTATVTFEVTLDDTNWVAIQTVNETDGSVATTAAANGIFIIPTIGKSQFRARISAWTSGTLYVYARAVTISPGVAIARS